MARTIRNTRKAWHECWPDSPGVGKRVRKALHKAERRAAREHIDAELFGTRPHERGLSNARGEVNYRTH